MPAIPSLTRFRKFELIEIAEALGLPTEGFRPDIEARIRAYLLENDVSSNAEVVSLLNAPRGTTPRKRTSRSTSPVGARSTRSTSRLKSSQPESPTPTPTKPFQRGSLEDSSEDEDKKYEARLERPKQPEFFIDAPDSEKIKKLFKIEKTELPEVISPFKPQIVDTTVSKVETTVVTEKTVVVPLAHTYKNSQVWKVLLFLLSVELAMLIYSSSYAVNVDLIQYHFWELHSSLVFSLPDITHLVANPELWRPIVTWFMVLVLVPFVLSHVVNIERDHPTFSPLTFSVTRSAIIYALRNRDDIFGQIYAMVPSSLLHITCAIGLVLATYRGITKPSAH